MKGDGRGGVCGFGSTLRSIVRNLGKAGVGAEGEATSLSMNSTSLASMLSILLSAANMIGVCRLECDWEREEDDGDAFCGFLRVDARGEGESGGAATLRRRGLGAVLPLIRTDPPDRPMVRLGVEGALPGVLDEDVDEGGRVTGEAGAPACLLRVGDGIRVGDGCLNEVAFGVFLSFSGVVGVTLIAAVRLT